MIFENNVYAFIEELRAFEYNLEGIDPTWKIIFSDSKGAYHYIVVTQYQNVFYISHVDGNLCSLEVRLEKSVEAGRSFGSSRYDDSSWM